MDNEPRNKDIVNQLTKYIDEDYSVCMFPDNVQEKDINEMVLAGRTIGQITDIINRNTFRGISARLKFGTWKRIN
jgi:hypothetical protein